MPCDTIPVVGWGLSQWSSNPVWDSFDSMCNIIPLGIKTQSPSIEVDLCVSCYDAIVGGLQLKVQQTKRLIRTIDPLLVTTSQEQAYIDKSC